LLNKILKKYFQQKIYSNVSFEYILKEKGELGKSCRKDLLKTPTNKSESPRKSCHSLLSFF